jgi:hypothetical protein
MRLRDRAGVGRTLRTSLGLGVLGIETDALVLTMTNMGVVGDFFPFLRLSSSFLFLVQHPCLLSVLRISNTKFLILILPSDHHLCVLFSIMPDQTDADQYPNSSTMNASQGTCLPGSLTIKISARQACYNS